MIKLYITCIESNPDGTAVTLFEDYKVGAGDLQTLDLTQLVLNKIEEVELSNEGASTTF